MRRGLMLWREDQLAAADVQARQTRLRAAMAGAALDGLLIYTNHVRSGGVTWLTGFTPYWSDGLVLLMDEGAPIFSTALSKRVGNWIKTVNPTSEIAHSPQPGRFVGERLAAAGARRVGVVELERLPGGLADEIISAATVDLVDATPLFNAVRGVGDTAELSLIRAADEMAQRAFAAADTGATLVGQITGPLERTVRLAGAEECYVAVAPDLSCDARLARMDGATPLSDSFAVRLSLAANGVWIRRTRSFSRSGLAISAIASLESWLHELDGALDLAAGGPTGIPETLPDRMELVDWHIEGPAGTRPLKLVAAPGRVLETPIPYGVLSVTVRSPAGLLVAARPLLARQQSERAAA